MSKIDGSRVLLTGASSGIGRELAKALGSRGARIAVTARRRDLLDELAAEMSDAGMTRPVVFDSDLSVPGSAADLAGRAQEELGSVEILVNNAGGGVGGRISAVGDRAEGREAFEVNYWSPLALIHSLIPGMTANGRGAVVNVTSMAQVSTWPGFGAYAATKAALAVATETLAMELTDTPIHVMEVAPGPVDTAVQGETRLAPGIDRMLGRAPLGDAAELARLIVRGLERGTQRLIYPRRARVAYLAPAVARWDARRLAGRAAREVDPEIRDALAGLVVRTGSHGDEIVQQARAAWERERGRDGELALRRGEGAETG